MTMGGGADPVEMGRTIMGLEEGRVVLNGRFTLKKMLGRGGMGVVWSAWDESLERDCALKFLPEIVRLDPEAIRDLKKEARRSQELSHKNIMTVHDFISDDELAGIYMELVKGQTLREAKLNTTHGFFEVDQISDWVRQACNALSYAHEDEKVIHRDLKPANIMVDEQGYIRIADFGISSSICDSVSRVSMRGATSGTLAYMSPQQAMGVNPSPSDDVYSVGATIYDLLTGKPPFYRGDLLAQLREVTPVSPTERRTELYEDDGITLQQIPANWEQTIMACLAKEPEGRPASIVEIADLLGLGGTLRGSAGIGPVSLVSSDNVTVKDMSSFASAPTLASSGSGGSGSDGGPKTSGHTAAVAAGVQTPGMDTAEVLSSARDGGHTATFLVVALGVALLALVVFCGLGGVATVMYLGATGELGPYYPGPETEKGEKPVKDSDPVTLPEIKTDPTPKPDTLSGRTLEVPTQYSSIQAAINDARVGDTVWVKAGTYNESIHMKSGIHLKGESASKVTVQNTVDREIAVLSIENVKGGSVSSMTFYKKGTSTEKKRFPVVALNNSSVKLLNCIVRKAPGHGVHIYGKDRSVLSGMDISGSAWTGIHIYEKGTRPTLENCFVGENSHSGISVLDGAMAVISDTTIMDNGWHGVSVWGKDSMAHVKSCNLQDNKRLGLESSGGARTILENSGLKRNKWAGIQISGEGTSADIKNNEITDQPASGVFIIKGAKAVLTHNSISDNTENGLDVQSKGTNVRLVGNSIQNNGWFGVAFAKGTDYELVDNEIKNNKKDNVFYNPKEVKD